MGQGLGWDWAGIGVGTGQGSGLGAGAGLGRGHRRGPALTTRPDVHRFAIGLFAQHLGGQVARCARKSWHRDREMGEESRGATRAGDKDSTQAWDRVWGRDCWAGLDMVGTGQCAVGTEVWTRWEQGEVGTGQMQQEGSRGSADTEGQSRHSAGTC